MAAICHFDFQILKILIDVKCGGLGASPRQMLSKSAKWLWRYGYFSFIEMAAVRHLRLVGRILGPLLRVLGGQYHISKLGWNPLSSF